MSIGAQVAPGPTCECGHSRSIHITGAVAFHRCTNGACPCDHYVARRVCRRCAGYGIAFDVAVREAQILRAGVELITYKSGQDAQGEFQPAIDRNGKPIVDERVLVRVDLVYPGVRAHHPFESRWARGFRPVATPLGLAAADLLRYPGDWMCDYCMGTGQRAFGR